MKEQQSKILVLLDNLPIKAWLWYKNDSEVTTPQRTEKRDSPIKSSCVKPTHHLTSRFLEHYYIKYPP